MTVKLEATAAGVTAGAAAYTWTWDALTDRLALYDAQRRCIAAGQHQPLLLTASPGAPRLWAAHRTAEAAGQTVTITYTGLNGAGVLRVTWRFYPDRLELEPLEYANTAEAALTQVVYFAQPPAEGDDHPAPYAPALYSRYAVVPGLCMSPGLSPIVDLHSHLNVTTVLGSGAMRGPGLTQQWGLPAHYFCTFNTPERWNARDARARHSAAACWGLRALPAGDFRLAIRANALSPVLNLRGDLWAHARTPGRLRLGLALVITFGANHYEATRHYYRAVRPTPAPRPGATARRAAVLLAPQYNTWGAEVAQALPPEALTQDLVSGYFEKLQRSGLRARTFVIDDKWEGAYGELRHDARRFPDFDALLDRIRGAGYFVGLWAAFLRCENPAALGLNETHLLQTPAGRPLWLSHQTAGYGIFDVTQRAVQTVLRDRARQFIHRYRPDLIKFDFGYELPALDRAAPQALEWAGERLLQKGLEVVVGAMKAENPDLVIMYYGLSPLLTEYYDLHSTDDLVYCGGDYDLETNRRIFFSSLAGELGMPTYGSSGYDWATAPDIWFDSVPSGSLGSLHAFDGDEAGDQPRAEWLARYNGLAAIQRTTTTFSIQPLEVAWGGGLRASFAPGWERLENGRSVLVALRQTKLDGRPGAGAHRDILHTDVTLVAASLTDDGLADTARLGLVPWGAGRCRLRRTRAGAAEVTEHYWGGAVRREHLAVTAGQVEVAWRAGAADPPLEWIEVVFTD
ncbi:MAG: hypothetical protein KA764_09985 [Anaerolineales bacterium]|nr:hypothetical protein [Anaerolineales bacterium]